MADTNNELVPEKKERKKREPKAISEKPAVQKITIVISGR